MSMIFIYILHNIYIYYTIYIYDIYDLWIFLGVCGSFPSGNSLSLSLSLSFSQYLRNPLMAVNLLASCRQVFFPERNEWKSQRFQHQVGRFCLTCLPQDVSLLLRHFPILLCIHSGWEAGSLIDLLNKSLAANWKKIMIRISSWKT